MQLFITNFTIQGDILLLENKDILAQIRKVLRGKIGDMVFFQEQKYDGNIMRYQVKISDLDRISLKGKIVKQEKHEYSIPRKILLVAFPNKWNKAELIAQKATELGIDEITFWPAQRSIIQQKNENKAQRIVSIAREASEQSRRWTIPTITFLEKSEHITSFIQDRQKKVPKAECIIFDIPRKEQDDISQKRFSKQDTALFGIIGPEGGLTTKDYENFGKKYQIQHLGDTVLRMETASIIAARELCKDK